MTRWRVERARDSAAALHEWAIPDPPARAVWLFEPTAPALVLGSAQPAAHVDAAAAASAGVQVVRRRSGGGAVLLVPAQALWVDVVIPAGDVLWQADVGAAFHWLGDAWAAALRAVDGPNAVVHRGAMVRSPWSAMVCFAGLGPGEVTVGGRKVVGISQRRTRSAARFQCAAYARWDAPLLHALLSEPRPSLGELQDMAAPAGDDLGALGDALVAALEDL